VSVLWKAHVYENDAARMRVAHDALDLASVVAIFNEDLARRGDALHLTMAGIVDPARRDELRRAYAEAVPLGAGATSILYPDWPTPAAVFELLRRYQPTMMFAVPTLYAAMLATAESNAESSSKQLRLCFSAGEPLPPHIGRGWKQRFGLDICNGVGSTEMGHLFLTNLPDAVDYECSGLPVEGYDMRLVDAAGEGLRVDRLVELDDAVWILDYKWSCSPGQKPQYERQLARYAGAIRALYPGRQVRTALILADATLAETGTGPGTDKIIDGGPPRIEAP